MSERRKIKEFHYITPIENIPSILEHGVLSYERIASLPHSSIAMEEVQEMRDEVKIPNGLRLHQYANFYLHTRNPMMYARKENAKYLCVLRVSTEARHIDGCVITDGNAASEYTRFLSIQQSEQLDLEAIYAEDWTHDNRIVYLRHKSQKCSEFLVPHHLPLKYIVGAYVVSEPSKLALEEKSFNFPITIDSHLFFR